MAKGKTDKPRRKTGKVVTAGALLLPLGRAIGRGYRAFAEARRTGFNVGKSTIVGADDAAFALSGRDPNLRGGAVRGKRATDNSQLMTTGALAAGGGVASKTVARSQPGRMANRLLVGIQRKLGMKTAYKF